MSDIDYRALLAKYIAHVGHEEGHDYIQEANPDDALGPRNPRNPVRFTRAEYEALLDAAGGS